MSHSKLLGRVWFLALLGQHVPLWRSCKLLGVSNRPRRAPGKVSPLGSSACC